MARAENRFSKGQQVSKAAAALAEAQHALNLFETKLDNVGGELALLRSEFVNEQSAKVDVAMPQPSVFTEALASETLALLDVIESSAWLAASGMPDNILESGPCMFAWDM